MLGYYKFYYINLKIDLSLSQRGNSNIELRGGWSLLITFIVTLVYKFYAIKFIVLLVFIKLIVLLAFC